MIQTLREFYGRQPTPPADLFQFFVWEILSHNALPARRDLAWQALQRIPALTPDAMFRTSTRDLLGAIGLAGPRGEQKLEQIRATAGEFRRRRDVLEAAALRRAGPYRAGRALRHLHHLSPAVRRRAQLFALDAKALPLDEEILRVAARLMGAPDARRRGAVRRWLAQRIGDGPCGLRDAVLYLRHHAQHTCLKGAPHCGVCPLRNECGRARSAAS